MAIAEHSRILKGGVAAWYKWRQETILLYPDLSGADLSHADFPLLPASSSAFIPPGFAQKSRRGLAV